MSSLNDVQNVCQKCNKVYKTKKYLLAHENKCNVKVPISEPKPKPKPKVKTTTKTTSTTNTQENPNVDNIPRGGVFENAKSVSSTTNNKKIIINNFGPKRIEHISEEQIKKILEMSAKATPLSVADSQHINNIPGNKTKDDDNCNVFEFNVWQDKDRDFLQDDEEYEIIMMYCDENDEIQLVYNVKETDNYDHIENKMFIVYNKTDNEKYNETLNTIMELIKST